MKKFIIYLILIIFLYLYIGYRNSEGVFIEQYIQKTRHPDVSGIFYKLETSVFYYEGSWNPTLKKFYAPEYTLLYNSEIFNYKKNYLEVIKEVEYEKALKIMKEYE